MKTLGAAVGEARERLAQAAIPDAAMEIRLLIGGLLKISATEVFTQTDRPLSSLEADMIDKAVARRLNFEPVHRILGSRQFYGLDLKLSSGTLEPRPDTEVLVDALLPIARRIAADKGGVRILDLGTGTGAIILALLHEIPQAVGAASDISTDALDTLRENASRLGLSNRLTAVQSNWFDKIDGVFDIIVSNPPYIRSGVIPGLAPEVRLYDPMAALDGGLDGLNAYRAIAIGFDVFLENHGIIGLEIGFDQRDTVTEVFKAEGCRLVKAVQDFAGNDRVLLLERL